MSSNDTGGLGGTAADRSKPRRLASVESGGGSLTPPPASPSPPPTMSSPIQQGCQRPYAVEGGAVPIFQLAAGGRINKRTWNSRNPNWCDLCKEPVSLWANHHGRKDHALLDLHYSSMVEFERNWDAEVLLKAFEDYMGLSIGAYHKNHAETDRRRRLEILALVRFLEREQVLNLTEPRNTFLSRMTGGLRGMDHQGALVMHRELLGTMMRFYPDGGIQDFSNLLDFISCAYNLETVYDLGGYAAVDPAAVDGQMKLGSTSPSALGLGGAAVGSTAANGFGSTTATGAGDRSGEALTDQEHQEAFSRKAVFVRLIFGQLRWVSVEDQVHPTGRVFPHHIVLSCELLLNMLMAECIAVRICEYMVRVESVWRHHGLERKKKGPNEVQNRESTPRPLRYSYRPMSTTYDDLFTLDEQAHRQAVKAELSAIIAQFGAKDAVSAVGRRGGGSALRSLNLPTPPPR